MRVAVDFQDERLELDAPEGRVIADWHGPAGVPASDVYPMVVEALENPREYPPLRQAVVPGDRVVVALDLEVPEIRRVLAAVCDTLQHAGVEASAITVLAASGEPGRLADALPPGVALAIHDPDDRKQMAYLAATSGGRRIYLSRLLADADVVLPIGRLGYDPVLGYRGPWGLLFPGLSDRETGRSYRALATSDWPDLERPRPVLTESTEVSWLLGSQFQVGLVAGTVGPIEVFAGLDSAVLAEGTRALDRAWTFEADSRAELVVVGIGRPGVPAGLDDLVRGLSTAAGLVERGGKIVALSRAEGALGPAVGHVLELEDPRLAPSSMKEYEAAPDHDTARQLAKVLAWADVYLLSSLDRERLEASSLIVLDRPEEARRLVSVGRSCLFLSQADLVRARVAGEAD